MIRAMLWIDALVLLVGLAGAWLLSRRLTSRLAHLTTAAESLGAEGVAPTPRDAAAGDEITRLGIAFDAMAHRVVDALTAREASEEQYRGLFESVPLPLYVADLDTRRFRAVNAALVESYGYSREELAQLTINNIRPADDLARLAQELQDLGERPSHRGQWQHVRKDGSVIDVEVVAHRCLFEGRPAVLCLANDVTARNRAALALQRSEERYRALIRESPYGIALSTPDGELLEVNPALVAMLGYDEPGQLLGTSVRNLYVDPAAREAIADELRRTGHSRQDALQWRRRDRRTLTARFSARLVPASRDAEAYVEAIIEDVTERLRLEEQFQQAQRMEAVGRLAGGIAHDFNNLLTVIMTTTELLLDAGTTTGSEHSELQDVYRSAQRGAELTRQLLAFSRRQVLTMQPLSVGALVADLKSLITRLIGEDVHLRVARAPDTDIVRADPTQLEQVLLNLAVNARDAMPNGGHLTIETGPVEIGPGTDDRPEPMTGGAYVRIVVSDTGEGMTDEVREHAFEPFFTTKDREKGTGLGLATVYGIVKQLGGYVWVNSELGKGTAFRIYLPRVADVPGEPVREASRRDAGAGAGTETVLIAEDEEAIRALLVRVLKSRGYQVLAEPSGEEALRRAAEFRDHIDLLVTDVVMTGMSGPQLAGRLAEIHPETTPLFLSGYTDEAVLKFGVAAGTVAFLQKPFTHNAFLAKVREVLDGVKR
jgi:PAS domain S-box-containing protein